MIYTEIQRILRRTDIAVYGVDLGVVCLDLLIRIDIAGCCQRYIAVCCCVSVSIQIRNVQVALVCDVDIARCSDCYAAANLCIKRCIICSDISARMNREITCRLDGRISILRCFCLCFSILLRRICCCPEVISFLLCSICFSTGICCLCFRCSCLGIQIAIGLLCSFRCCSRICNCLISILLSFEIIISNI